MRVPYVTAQLPGDHGRHVSIHNLLIQPVKPFIQLALFMSPLDISCKPVSPAVCFRLFLANGVA